MALPMLVGGADCGPINPLQNLSKRFDQGGGLQQDHYGAGRAGSSKEVFRSQPYATTSSSHDAAAFFSQSHSRDGIMPTSSAYNLSALHTSLPAVPVMQSKAGSSHAPLADWALDFMQQPASISTASQASAFAQSPMSLGEREHLAPSLSATHQNTMHWTPAHTALGPQLGTLGPQLAASVNQAQMPTASNTVAWEQVFNAQESALSPTTSSTVIVDNTIQEAKAPVVHDADEFSRTAGQLLQTVESATNPKFKNSQFLGLMRQVRDREIVVEGNDLVQREDATSSPSLSWATPDVKGKGRALDPSSSTRPMGSTVREDLALLNGLNQTAEGVIASHLPDAESEIDAYFRQQSDDYIAYWNDVEHSVRTEQSTAQNHPAMHQMAEWDKLQQDWDAFEASSTGIRAIGEYQFAPNNPYLVGEASRTRQHALHTGGSLYESLMEMEATVQRDRTDARAWYQLGVKQQENEREQKAIHALRRALELDPTHLPSWVALAVSHTNEGNRQGTFEAIRQWVERNEHYRAAVQQYRMQYVEHDDMTQSEKFTYLAECLMAMARSEMGHTVDPDIQIALAVLLNAKEEYDKSRDCFITALALRPDDWLLYNRVGATLANGGRSEEALQYYYRALELNPSYIRARFNLGISCINLRRYEEGAESILDALVLQDSDSSLSPGDKVDDKRGVTSGALWDTLKTCCLHMQRLDLATLCDRQDLDAFRLNYQLR